MRIYDDERVWVCTKYYQHEKIRRIKSTQKFWFVGYTNDTTFCLHCTATSLLRHVGGVSTEVFLVCWSPKCCSKSHIVYSDTWKLG